MEVLLMRRSQQAKHFGGAHVFPGGVVEKSDSDPRALRHVVGMTAAEADRRLSVGSDALSYWVAVVRECYEEAGILLVRDEHNRPLTAQHLARLAPYRAALHAGEVTLADILEPEHLVIRADQIAYAAHWVTPPIRERRFDTRFFVAVAPEDQVVNHDKVELVESLWLSPAEALHRAECNEIDLHLPTRSLVSTVGRFSSPTAALQQALSLVQVPRVRPCSAQGREGTKMFRLGDPAYDEIHWVDPDESGSSTYDLVPAMPKQLDRYVVRLLAPNASAMTGRGTNCYLVGDRELAVIDPGPNDAAHIRAIVEAGAGRIRWILLTHTHTDHAPGALALQAATGAKIAGRPVPDGTEHNVRIGFDRVLVDGEIVKLDGCALQVIHTPGHASNHLCFLLAPTRMLFSGDHIIQGSTVVIWPPDGNMESYLKSLRELASTDIAILAPGHGYLIGNVRDECTRLIAHRLARETKVRLALKESGGRATLQALLPRVYDDVPQAIHPVAARSLQAHLEKLVSQGEILNAAGVWTQ